MSQAVAKLLFPDPDPTFYPVDDDMGEGLLHREIAEVLRLLLQRFLTQQGAVARVGANQFIYLVQFDAEKSVAPDVYVLPGVTLDTSIQCWKVWETGIVPSFALEVVSRSRKKDYDEVIRRYAALGVQEVVIFDPSPRVGRGSSRRVRFQIYRRVKSRGLVRVEVTNEDRIKSNVLDCWLRVVGNGEQLRLRVATGPKGEQLFPTEAEEALSKAEAAIARADAEQRARRAEAARAEAEAARAEAEAARAEAEAARAEAATARADAEQRAREAAEAELSQLRKALAQQSPKKRRRRT
jgi:Uma2 family endonuclease